MPRYVLDTSAIMRVLIQEEGSEQVVEILEASRDGEGEPSATVLVPFIALMEVEYWLLRRLDPADAATTLLFGRELAF